MKSNLCGISKTPKTLNISKTSKFPKTYKIKYTKIAAMCKITLINSKVILSNKTFGFEQKGCVSIYAYKRQEQAP